jgi:hypothetical protein
MYCHVLNESLFLCIYLFFILFNLFVTQSKRITIHCINIFTGKFNWLAIYISDDKLLSVPKSTFLKKNCLIKL